MSITRIIVGLVAAATIVVALVAPTYATTYGGGSIQPYAAERPLDYGTIVTLTNPDKQLVAPATQGGKTELFGVAVDPQQLSVSLADDGLKNQTYVAASGTYNVLVSTQSGPIKSGDYITLSAINGVGMNAGAERVAVIGRAAGSFDGEGHSLGTTTLKDEDGNKLETVKLGLVPVTIKVEPNPDLDSTKVDAPDFLEELGQQIAQKRVSPIRIYICLAIMAASIITTILMLYSGVKNAVVSIGRNPLSKKSIFRALLQTILVSLLVLIIGLFAVYLLLKL